MRGGRGPDSAARRYEARARRSRAPLSKARTLAVGLALILLVPVQGDRGISVDDTVSCEECEIFLEPVHYFATPEFLCGGWSLTWTGSHYALAPGCDPGRVVLVDPSGEVQATLGGTGQGPGERDRVLAVSSDGRGRLLVFSWSRVQMYDGEQLVMERALPSRLWPRDLALLEDGGFVVASRFPTANQVPTTLHVFDGSGELVRSLARDRVWTAEADRLSWRRVTPADDGSIWSARQRGTYTIERWSTSGEKLASYERDPSAFSGIAWDSDRAPSVRAIREHEGLLWTLTWVRSPQDELDQIPERDAPAATREPLPLSQALPGGPSDTLHLTHDTSFEVLDLEPDDGELVASRRTTDAFRGFLPGTALRVWTYRVSDDPELDELVTIEVYDVSIH